MQAEIQEAVDRCRAWPRPDPPNRTVRLRSKSSSIGMANRDRIAGVTSRCQWRSASIPSGSSIGISARISVDHHRPVQVGHPAAGRFDGRQRRRQIGGRHHEVEVLVEAGPRVAVADLDQDRSLDHHPRMRQLREDIGHGLELDHAPPVGQGGHLVGGPQAGELAGRPTPSSDSDR